MIINYMHIMFGRQLSKGQEKWNMNMTFIKVALGASNLAFKDSISFCSICCKCNQ